MGYSYRELERRLKRQLSETVRSNDVVIELPALADYKAWQARWRRHIRCMVWWDELKKPEPRVGRVYCFAAPEITAEVETDLLFFPWYEKPGEWRTRKQNPPTQCCYWSYDGDRVIQAPALIVPRRGMMLLDASHRIDALKPRLIVLDTIEVEPEQLTSFADVLGAWWHDARE